MRLARSSCPVGQFAASLCLLLVVFPSACRAFSSSQHRYCARNHQSRFHDFCSLSPFPKESGTRNSNHQNARTPLRASASDNSASGSDNRIWNPRLRQVLGGVATAGALETAFITYNKLTGQVSNLCGVDGACNDVLSGPYSTIPFTDLPLSIAGFLAYTTVAALAIAPLLDEDNTDDSANRVALTALSTGMATFSIWLMAILFGVLQTSCPYCIFSAACSVVLAKLTWIGGCLPEQEEDRKAGAQATSATFLTATLGAMVLFFGADESAMAATSASSASSSPTLLASSEKQQIFAPPAITTQSSAQAMELANELQGLDAKMYGAYWCSHCFDQKEALGKEAFRKITYVECSKDGYNSQTKLCKEKEVPGYPTWEINGKLYPGQQELDELEELIKKSTEAN